MKIRKTMAILTALAILVGGCFTPPAPPTPPTPYPPEPPIPQVKVESLTPAVSFDHVIGLGNFLGAMPWKDHGGIYNNAPKDMSVLVSQFAKAGGTLLQVQLMYQEGAIFLHGKGLQLDSSKIAYCLNLREICRANGVAITYVLFDHCSLKYPNNWLISPLNTRNGGPFKNPYDIYSHGSTVLEYVTLTVMNLHSENVVWEIINEGTSAPFASLVRDRLHDMGVVRITNSGAGIGNIWRGSPHISAIPNNVKAYSLPNTDGTAWNISNVTPVCRRIRSTLYGGFVFDGATDKQHDWNAFLAAIRAK